MAGFVVLGVDREQVTLFPARLDEYVAEDNPVRGVDGLDLDGLGFIHVQLLDIGRPGYHPRTDFERLRRMPCAIASLASSGRRHQLRPARTGGRPCSAP